MNVEPLLWRVAQTEACIALMKSPSRRISQRSVPAFHPTFLVAELLQRVTLKPDGTMFGSSIEEIEAAELVKPEIVRIGSVRMGVIDSNPTRLATAAGAIEEGAMQPVCLLVEFDQGADAARPFMGQYIVLSMGDGVALTFVVWLTHGDLHDPAAPDLGPDAVRNEALDAIGPNQALLVQVTDLDDESNQ